MVRHQVSGNWRVGALLAAATMLLWSSLPVALDVALESMDPFTLTWVRFLAAGLVSASWLVSSGRVRRYASVSRGGWLLLGVAALALTSNYVLYLLGLSRTSPGNIQVIIQLGPVFLALGAMLVYGERYSRAQWIGFLTLLTGLGIFFRDQIAVLAGDISAYAGGVALIALAAAVWAAYALAQKQILSELSSPLIMLFIYAAATVLLAPFASPSQLLALDWVHGIAVAYCAFNTLAAYAAFSEALNHWEASRVGAILALTPLGTLTVVGLLAGAWPEHVRPESISVIGLLGALIVVAGSMTTSLGARRRRTAPHAVTACEEPGPAGSGGNGYDETKTRETANVRRA